MDSFIKDTYDTLSETIRLFGELVDISSKTGISAGFANELDKDMEKLHRIDKVLKYDHESVLRLMLGYFQGLHVDFSSDASYYKRMHEQNGISKEECYHFDRYIKFMRKVDELEKCIEYLEALLSDDGEGLDKILKG